CDYIQYTGSMDQSSSALNAYSAYAPRGASSCDNGAAGGEGGGDLKRDIACREIPGCEAKRRADWFFQRNLTHVRAARRDHPSVRAFDFLRIPARGIGTKLQFALGLGERLAFSIVNVRAICSLRASIRSAAQLSTSLRKAAVVFFQLRKAR